MKSLWRIPDFLDLEFFFIQDKQLEEEQGAAALRDRDRTLYLNEIAPDLDAGAEPDREWLIYRWLQLRRSHENTDQGGQALLPGRMWYELYGLFWSLFSFLAVAAGAGLAYSFLSYSGKQPVNVSQFFLVFVGFQVVALVLLLGAMIYRTLRGLDLRSSLLLSLVNRGLSSFLFKIRKYGLDRMESSRRSQFAAALAAVRSRGKGYGSVFFWPLFLLFQLFGIAFNFGVLGAVLMKVSSVDLAFGWQSTIQLSSQCIANGVSWLALPWSWALGSSSYPGLSQIEGSRMILKDGFYHLASADLVSWWPFLCFAICCYCLLPRIILFVAGTFGRNRSMAQISFRRVEHNQLVHRLLTPRLETSLHKEVNREALENPVVAPVVRLKTDKDPVGNGTVFALVPDELFDDCKQEEFEQLCHQAYGYKLTAMLRLDDDYDGDTLFEQLQQGKAPVSVPLVILQEAWQPPIQEVLRFLRELRGHCDTETPIIVALVGRPVPDTIFTEVSDTDLRIWQQKVATLLDPCLQLSPLVEIS